MADEPMTEMQRAVKALEGIKLVLGYILFALAMIAGSSMVHH